MTLVGRWWRIEPSPSLSHASEMLDRERFAPEPKFKNSGEVSPERFLLLGEVTIELETRERGAELGADLLQHLERIVPTQTQVVEETACRCDLATAGDPPDDGFHVC